MHQKNTFLHPDYKLDTGTDTGYGYGYKSVFLVRVRKKIKKQGCVNVMDSGCFQKFSV